MNSAIYTSFISFMLFTFSFIFSSMYDMLEAPYSIQRSSCESDHLLATHNIAHSVKTEPLSISKISEAINYHYDNNLLLFDCSWCTPIRPKDYFSEVLNIIQCQNKLTELTQADLKQLTRCNAIFKQSVNFYTKKALKKIDKTTYSTNPQTEKMYGHLLPQNIDENFRTYVIKKAHNSIPFHYKTALPHFSPITAWNTCKKKSIFVSATENGSIILWDLKTEKRDLLTETKNPLYNIALSFDGKQTAFCTRNTENKTCALQIWENSTKKCIAQYTGAPYYVKFITYTSNNEIFVKGSNKKTDPLSDYYFNTLRLINSIASASKINNSRASLKNSNHSSNSSHQSESDDNNSKIVVERKGYRVFLENHKNEKGYLRHYAVIHQKSMPVLFLTKAISNIKTQEDLDEIKNSPLYASLWQIQQRFIDQLIEQQELPFKTKLIQLLSSFPGYDFFGIPKPEDWIW
jgi:hypothetical protein